jgi:CheY-like chemotaxis protein
MSEEIPRILLIDDDRLQQRMAEEHFKRFKASKYVLDWAPTYEDGITQLLSGKYAACLLDYQLAGRARRPRADPRGRGQGLLDADCISHCRTV